VADTTSLVTDARGRVRWWTFAGWRANLWLASAAADLRREVAAIDDLTVALDPSATPQQLRRALSNAAEAPIDLIPWVTTEAVDGLKFSECLPPSLATEVVAHRLTDPESTTRALGERLVGWRDAT
jgi:ATP-dependent Lhr-like helicase